jgi:hypothetical protein
MGVVLVAGIIVQIVNQNVTNTASDWTKYGHLSVPGAGVFTLPSGSLDLILEDDVDTGLTIPKHITVSVMPQAGAQPAIVTRDVGQPFGGGSYGDTESLKRVWRVSTPAGGRYRVVVGGTASDTALQLDIGHAPGLGAFSIWLWVLIAEAILLCIALVIWLRARRSSAT